MIRIELIFHCLCKTRKGRERLRDMEKLSTERRDSLVQNNKIYPAEVTHTEFSFNLSLFGSSENLWFLRDAMSKLLIKLLLL